MESRRDCFAWQILGLLVTYFLLVVQLADNASAGVASTSANATNATMPTNWTSDL